MDLTQAVTFFAIVVTNIGTVLALYFQMDRKLDENRQSTTQILLSIQTEMKDFHTKLAVQDLEFKMRLCAIEEKKHEHRS